MRWLCRLLILLVKISGGSVVICWEMLVMWFVFGYCGCCLMGSECYVLRVLMWCGSMCFSLVVVWDVEFCVEVM